MASIQGIYVALFGRPADPAGLQYFNTATNNGANLNAIGDLAATAEYQDRFKGMDNASIVTAIYQSLFGRNPELAGLTFFVDALNKGTININNVAINILDGAKGDDLAVVNNKIEAANAFTTAIDTPDELAAYRGDAAADAGRAFLAPITADDATVPSADATTAALAAVVAEHQTGGIGGTFALTAGADFASDTIAFINGTIPSEFRVTAASETVEALAGTLNATDALQDKSTTDNDVLNLRTNAANSLSAVAATVQNIETVHVIASGDAGGALDLSTVFTGGKTLTVSGTLAAAGGGLQLSNYVAAGFHDFDFSGITTTGADGGVTLTGGAASDVAVTIKGGAGDDVFSGGSGADTINGGAGNDTINGGAGDNHIDGGAGNDTVNVTSGNNTIELGAGAGAQSVTATTGANTITATGATGTVAVTVGNGANTITLGDSADTVTAGNGANKIVTGAGIDNITVGNGNNTIEAGSGNDIITVGTGNNTITGGTGADSLTLTHTGGVGANSIVIGSGDSGVTTATADSITGFLSGSDTLKIGLAGVEGAGGNYTEVDSAVVSVETAVTAASALFTGGVHYALVADTAGGATDSYLVWDLDGDGNADGAVHLIGTTAAQFAGTDIA